MNGKWVLYEDQDIIVCHKAAGIATQTARVGQADMVSEVANYLAHSNPVGASGRNGGVRRRNGKTQSMPYVGVVHRLDQPVEGILVFAKNKDAAAGLSRQMAGKEAEKYYYAIICGQDFEKEGELEDYLLKDGRTNLSSVVPREVKDAKRAALHYEVLAEKMAVPETDMVKDAAERREDFGKYRIALVRIRLDTGRHHQIRVQMSHAGMSLLGDHKYADAKARRISELMQVKKIALCAYQLSFLHPRTGARLWFRVRPEGNNFHIDEFMSYYEKDAHM